MAAQQSFGPPTLPVGTEVSAKYRGAFCEAKVKTVVRVVKCKILMKDSQNSIIVIDDEIKGPLKLGGVVEVKHPDTEQPVEATINKLIDQSTYTVVFDDGDERTLRRSQLCLKGDKHFIESETLDNLPLSHPEHFGTPVLQNKKAKSKAEDDSENEDDESEEESPRRAMYRGRHQELVGKLMLIDLPQRKGSAIPALVVLPDANSISEVKSRDQILVRSFKDSKFMTVTRKDLKEFSRQVAIKNEDKTMRTAFEKALLYFDTKELPVGWKKEDMLGSDIEDDDEGQEENEYASEDEPFEEKDRFVAQLYKFMDDRGTPINKGPCIGNKDLNLYKLFKIVQHVGGYNKVTKEMKWPVVYSKMGLPSLHQNPAHQIKTAYKKYLDAYETFYRKLGSTMGTLSRPGRVRHNSGRSILNFRGRDKSPRSPKPTEKLKAKEEAETPKPKTDAQEKEKEKVEDLPDSSNSTSKEESDLGPRRTQRRDRLQAVKEKEEVKEKKDDSLKAKEKKEDAPKGKKEDVASVKVKEEVTPSSKIRKDEAGKGKKEEISVKKEERKSTRKISRVEEEKEDKEEKKPIRGQKKDVKEEAQETTEESPKKRLTRRKLIQSEPVKKEAEMKEEVDEKREAVKKQVTKETKPVEKKEKEIPRTLERRESKAVEKKEIAVRAPEKKEVKAAPEKKTKPVEERKSARRERKGKDSEKEEDATDGEEDESSDQEKSDSSVAKNDCPIGSKIKVKYGKGKNQKIYIAKVVDIGKEGNHKTYLVHYAGWNNRYDEWIKSDRVVSVLDRPEVDKSDKAKTPAIKSQTAVISSIKRLSHRSPIMTKKVGQVFRTPKIITAKTRATRSSTEIKALPAKIGKRSTRRSSTVSDTSESKSEAQQEVASEENSKTEVSDDSVKDKEEEEEEETTSIEIEEEEEEETMTEKTDLDTSMDEEEETHVKEEKVTSETVSTAKVEAEEIPKSVNKEEVKSNKTIQEVLKDTQDVIHKDENASLNNEVVDKNETSGKDMKVSDVVADDIVIDIKVEKASVRVAEMKNAGDEITSIVSEPQKDNEEKKEVCFEDSSEIHVESQVESVKEESSSPQINEEESSVSLTANKDNEDIKVTETEEESSSLDQNIPQLKKIDLELERKELEERRKIKRGKRDVGKEGQKLKSFSSEGSSFNSNSSGEIPTLEPIFITAATSAPKSSPSPYDFDETETEAQWQPEITKKWEPLPSEQISTSTENNLTSEDNQEKEKKKVKKKAKKKPISPQFISDAKAEESAASVEENVEAAPESDAEKKVVRRKGRKKKEMNVEVKKEVMEQYELTVNSVVEAVKHSLKEDDGENDVKPVIKKRRLKRVSESDKKDSGRSGKVERKRGVRDSLDTVEALNVEGSKEKSSLSASNVESFYQSDHVSENVSSNPSRIPASHAADSVPVDSNKNANISESQGFVPQLQERNACQAPYENTPPTTPEYDDCEDGATAASSSQPPQNSSPCSDDLIVKTDSHKDSSSSSSSISLPASSAVARAKSASESPSDNDMTSTASTDNLEIGTAAQHSAESSGTEQEPTGAKKRKSTEGTVTGTSVLKKKKRVHGTRSRTARKSPKYIANDSSIYNKIPDSSGSSGGTPNHCPDSPSTRLLDMSKSPRPSKYNFNADLGEHLEGEARCNFLISKMREIKTIYMSLKSEVASIDRRRKRIRRKERESSQTSPNDRDGAR